nr:IseA DL-endopeptidase inhibitor family protein [Neobacillus sp. Marseille-Q6967]
MRRNKWNWIVMFSACIVLLAGCNLFPSPESLIQLPKQVEAFVDEDILSIARRNLPKATELSVAKGPVGSDSVMKLDLDADKKEEALVLYRSTTNPNQVGAFVLKENKKKWEKIFAKQGTGSEFSWASATDITGDGKDEILLGWQSGGADENVLEIYQWDKNKLSKLKELTFHELELIRFEGDPMTRVALWKRDMADAYKIDLLGWSGESFVADKSHYPSYFQKVIAYYEQRSSEVPDAAYNWYYLADAHLKANHPEQALEAVNKGFKLKSVVPTQENFKTLKSQIEKKLMELENTEIDTIVNPKYTSLEDEYVLNKVKEASKKYSYVMSGGKMPEGQVKTVTINNIEYRYLGSDLDTNAKMLNYLSDSFTLSAIDSFRNNANIFEYFEKLIQPNADGGSLLNYDEAVVVQKRDKGNEKEFDIKVPLVGSLTYEFVHISFQKTENGWRIFSTPGSF